jgi:GT2 family glycosyltransferase
MSIELSVGIVNWNTKGYLADCLDSLRQNLPGIAYEVIVADNNSGDGSAEMIKERFPWVCLIENSANLGYAKANNQIFALAQGERFLLLNPDVVIVGDALIKMIGFLDADRSCGAVCPRYLNPDGSFQRFYRRWPDLKVFLIILSRFFSRVLCFDKRILDAYYYRLAADTFDRRTELLQPAASCLMLRSSMFRKTYFLDEQFPIFFNDVDLCRRIHKQGYSIILLPEAQVIHHLGKSRTLVKQFEEKEYILSWLRYLRKYQGVAVFIIAKAVLFCEYLVLTLINLGGLFMGSKSFQEYNANLRFRRDIILGRGGF